jgi:anti-sigma factor RsiW
MSQQLPSDLHERITALIDGQITSAEERAEVESSIASHESARVQHSIESALVRMLHARRATLRENVPADVERRIRMALANEVGAPTSVWQNFFAAVIRPIVAIPVLAASIAAGVFLVMQQRSTPDVATVVRSPLVNLHEQAYENFASIVRGELTVAVASDSKHELESWFRNNGVQYEVQFPDMSATLVGGVVSTHEHKKFAHLVYSVGSHIVYMFEVDQASLASGEVALEHGIADRLEQGRWHWEERQDTGTLFVWKSNNVVCAAVSGLRTDELSALFNLNVL